MQLKVALEHWHLTLTCNYVVSVRRGFLFLWVHRMGCVILLWHSLSFPYNYFEKNVLALVADAKCMMVVVVHKHSAEEIRCVFDDI